VQNLLSKQKYKKEKDSVTSLAIYKTRKKVESSTNIYICSINSIRKAKKDCSLCSFRRAKIILLYNFIKKVKRAETIL